MNGSQEIPTTAPPPPGAALKNRGDQWAISPAKRNKVIPRVITAGTKIKPRMLREESDSGMNSSFRAKRFRVILVERGNLPAPETACKFYPI
jgi:hypothetical protein